MTRRPHKDSREPDAGRGAPTNLVAGFLVRLLVVYVILAVPWPAWIGAYGQCFRAMARAVFHDNDRRELTFETTGATSDHPLDTRIEIANRALLHEDGSGPVRDLDIDAFFFAWDPTALLIALIIATPIPWRRRGMALALGLPLLQAIILILLGFCIWDESAQIGLVSLNPFWSHVAGVLQGLITEQSAMAWPAMVWIVVTFRREDWRTIGLWQRRPELANPLVASV